MTISSESPFIPVDDLGKATKQEGTGSASEMMFDRAIAVFPGGLPTGTTARRPHQVYIDHAEGCYLYDLDGRQIVDFMNCAHSLPFGHRHPPTIRAIQEQADKGLHFLPLNNYRAVEYAEMLCARIPSLERLRFACSGTEATMYAMRLARAFTGRERILRMEGSYHGTHDGVCIGEADMHPMPTPGTSGHTAIGWGVPKALVDTSAFAEFNNLDNAREAFEKWPGQFAAIIVEPIPGAGGHIPPEPGYLEGLRQLCDDNNAVLIFDELISVSVGPGGAQGVYGVLPDLTTTGKGIAGGMPIGVVGGRKDIMSLSEDRGTHAPVFISSTFAGHPLVMVAGIETIKHLTSDVYEKMEYLGEYMRSGMREVISGRGAPMQVTGAKHLIGFHMSETPVKSFGQARGDPAAKSRISLYLMSQGFHVPPGRASVTSVHNTEIIDRFLEAFDRALVETGVAN